MQMHYQEIKYNFKNYMNISGLFKCQTFSNFVWSGMFTNTEI